VHQAESSSSLFPLWTGLSLPAALHLVSRRRSCLPLRTDQCFCPMRTFTSLLVCTFRRTPLTPSACMVRSSFTVCRISAPPPPLPLTSHQSLHTAIRVWRYPAFPALPGVFTAAAALAAQRPLRDIQSDLEERPLLEAHPRLSPTVQSFAPARLDRRLPRSA
jgi:hypothetical protein